jgi:hypothetical protein
MIASRRPPRRLHVAVLICALGSGIAPRAQDEEARRPSLSLRATPVVGFTPLRTRLVAELRDGDDDYAEFYCPMIEWDWGDGTVSESSEDCDPYVPGESEIRRRYSTEHIFRSPGTFRITFRIKQQDSVIAITTATIRVQGGFR